ncbi:uncharacterized protein LOC111060321 [Nilaparvata lugens]|uniref:uncharacterized protein LOC111060321 n=1 Tax=Nilaparvata lugens TaxID=108931 RepID=UPI00193DF2D8|nr:uncharacterized protein LOC111060321 [Nilaparvata lugens]XP_022203675.2 uncharacterized protein LOC111060321 [Nilaparvata lugens]
MDPSDLPPPCEPIDNIIGNVAATTLIGQQTQAFEMKLGTNPKSKSLTNKKSKKINITATKKIQWDDVSVTNILTKDREHKKIKEEKDIPQQENRLPSNETLMPDFDFKKSATDSLVCADITHPKYKKPFDYGWRRELVWRATVHKTKARHGDVYYYTPYGLRLRSMVELALVDKEEGLTLDNFSFFPEPTGTPDREKETIRHAVFRDKESIIQQRKELRERMKNMKRKVVYQPVKRKKKQQRTHQDYSDNEDSDFDQEMADEMMMALYNMKRDRDCDYKPTSKIVMDHDDDPEFSPCTRLRRKSSGSMPPSIGEEASEASQVTTESVIYSTTNPTPRIKTEIDCESNQESRPRILHNSVTNEQQVVTAKYMDCTNVPKIKQETVDPEPLSCLLISSVRTDFQEFSTDNEPIISQPNVQFKTDITNAKDLKTVSNSDKSVQTEDAPKECNEKDLLIDRLKMENMFLKEKLADLEKVIGCRQHVGKAAKHSSSAVANETADSDSDCELICVEKVEMKYETVDIDSD